MEDCLENKVVPDYEWCSVDKLGNMYSTRSGKPYKTYNQKGYREVCTSVSGKRVHLTAHRAVALAFLKDRRPDQNQVNHINGIKHDNRLENLEWSNASEQQYHAADLGLTRVGVDSHFNKHSEDVIRQICAMIDSGYRVCDISNEVGIHRKTVSDIKNFYSWRHISKDYKFYKQ